MQRAARFYYLQRLAFGSKVVGQSFGVSATTPARLNLLRLEEELSEAHLRLARVTIEHMPWADCIARYDRAGTLFFCDPSYWRTEGYGVAFGMNEYERLAEVLGALKGRAILTINDHPDMQRLFDRFRRKRVEIGYTVGGSGRSRARAGELIYRTW